MQAVTVIWSMIAAASLTLGLLQLLVWWQNRAKWDRLYFFLAAVATAWFAWFELGMMKAERPGDYAYALRWCHVPVLLAFIGVIGFVFFYLRAGRIWLAGMALGVRAVALLINFSMTPNINFKAVTGLRRVAFLGDWISLPQGIRNPWLLVANAGLVLWLVFVVDATVSVWRRGEKRKALLVGGSTAALVFLGSLQVILAQWFAWDLPIGGSIYFMGMLAVSTFDLSLETMRANRLEKELRDTQERQHEEVTHLGRVAAFGEISGSLAHEMNQPLGIILSNAQAAQRLLSQSPSDLGEVRDILEDIVRENLRAGEVIQRMRALLRRGVVNHQPLCLNEVAGEVISLMRSTLQERAVTAEQIPASSIPAVSADRIQLQQVLLNLMLNACEAMETGGTEGKKRELRIATGTDGKMVSLTVTDNGPGLPPDPEILFEPFHTTKAQGMGMGLAICRSIVHAHHGQIWAASPDGQGAVFYVVLPAVGGAA